MADLNKIPSSFELSKTVQAITFRTINEFGMIAPNDAVLVAVSGGPDSVTLVRILQTLKTQYQISLSIAHFNHMLRGEESQQDEAFVKCLAEKLGLPYFCQRQDVASFAKKNKLSIETAGRDLRYHFFNQLLVDHGYTKIATGHTQDDNSEQVLMNLLRGSGTTGLSGIPPVRDSKIIRPLIHLSKNQILTILKNNQHPYRVDSSNVDPAYLRNRIRNNLIPLLETDYNPEIKNALNRLSQVLRQENDYMDQQTDQAFQDCLVEQDEHRILLSRSRLKTLHPALLNRILRHAIKQLKTNLNSISLLHLNTIIDFCFHSSLGKSLDLPGQIRIYKTKEAIEIKKEARPLREIGTRAKEKKRSQQNNQDRQN